MYKDTVKWATQIRSNLFKLAPIIHPAE